MYWSVVVISKVARADWGDLENCHVMPGLALGRGGEQVNGLRSTWSAPDQDQKSAHSSRWDEEGQGSCKTKGKCFLIVFIIENGKWICGCVCVCVSEWVYLLPLWEPLGQGTSPSLRLSLSPFLCLPPRALLHLSPVSVCGLRSLFVGVDSAWADSVGLYCLIIEGRSTHNMKILMSECVSVCVWVG